MRRRQTMNTLVAKVLRAVLLAAILAGLAAPLLAPGGAPALATALDAQAEWERRIESSAPISSTLSCRWRSSMSRPCGRSSRRRTALRRNHRQSITFRGE
jgi:hypothetical protein